MIKYHSYTGVFSIAASKYARNCVGIESSITSVEDAMHNALINYVENCEFIPGHVETVIILVLITTPKSSFQCPTNLYLLYNFRD